MNGECGSSNTAPETSSGRLSPPALRRRQGGEEPSSPGPALHVRPKRLSVSKRGATAARATRPGEFILATEDGALAFSMRTTYSGLYVERTQGRPLGARLVQSIVFDGSEAFLRWCAADPVRFDHPLLFGRLRRQGDELLRTKP